MTRRHQRADDFQEFLQLVHDHYRGHPVTRLLDGDSSRTADGSEPLAADLGIAPEWLPVRSPELNAIEDLWDHAKDAVYANHQYPDIETQTGSFVEYARSLTNHEAQRITGLLNDGYRRFQ